MWSLMMQETRSEFLQQDQTLITFINNTNMKNKRRAGDKLPESRWYKT